MTTTDPLDGLMTRDVDRELGDLLPHEVRELEALHPRDVERELDEFIRIASTNFHTVEAAYAQQRDELEALKRRPPRDRRTGAAARVNPDNIHVFYGVLVGSLLLPIFTFAASFAFQRAFGVYTPLEEEWWWVIPVILELPLVVLTPMILVFRRRHESTIGPWLLMAFLVAAAAAINFQHAVVEQGLTTATDWLGALFIASWPILTLVTFKFFTRLAVKPEPKSAEVAPAARKAPQKRSTKK